MTNKKKTKNYKKEYELSRVALRKARLSYQNLQWKYSHAVSTLTTLSCKTVNSNSPKEFAHDLRMAWTASDCLKTLAQREQTSFPALWEFNL